MFTIYQAAKYLRISPTTLRRWDRTKRLCAQRTLGNHRRYPKSLLDTYLGIDNGASTTQSIPSRRIPWVYSRVSTAKQDKDGNLDRQTDRLIQYIHKHYGHHQKYNIVKEYGSGLNAERKGLQKLIHAVINHQVSEVIIEFSDRITRFGYPFLETLFGVFDVPIIAVQTKSTVRLEEQLVEDLLMLMASFSGKFFARLSDLFSRLQHSEKPLLKFNPTESSVDSSVTMTLAEMLKQLEKISGILDAVNAIYKFQIPVILHVFATPVVIDYALALGFENAEGGFAYWFHEEKDFDRFFSMMKALQHQLMQIAHLKSISKGISKPKKNKVT